MIGDTLTNHQTKRAESAEAHISDLAKRASTLVPLGTYFPCWLIFRPAEILRSNIDLAVILMYLNYLSALYFHLLCPTFTFGEHFFC